jgi:hypothetical protein
MPPRYWHMALIAAAAAAIFVMADFIYLNQSAGLPGLKQIWGLALAVPLLCGAAVTLGAAGADLKQRIIGAALCGVAVGAFSTLISAGISSGNPIAGSQIIANSIWRIFIFTIFTVVGLLLTEINLPAPDDRGQRAEDGGQKA